jgi:hypothetical protein
MMEGEVDVLRQIPGADVRRMKGGWTISTRSTGSI